MKTKRLFICTLGGVAAGLICSIGGLLSGNIPELTFFAIASPFFNRIMLGFVIGISNLKINYLLHGILMGFLVSCINSIAFLQYGLKGFLFFTIAGMIYGLLIEWFATRVFKVPVLD